MTNSLALLDLKRVQPELSRHHTDIRRISVQKLVSPENINSNFSAKLQKLNPT